MSDNKTRSERPEGYAKIILKENSASFAKWNVPDVDEEEKLEEDDELFPMLTAEQLEEIHQQAHDEGYEQGLKNGFDEGSHNGFEEGKALGHKQAYDSAKKEIQQKAEQMHELLKSIEKPFSNTVKEVENEVQQLAFVIAKHIIRQEISTSPEYIQTLAAQAVSLLPSSNKIIKIYCHPQDLELIEDYFSTLDDADKIEHKLIKDPSMQAGGIRIDSDTSYIDESLETRFAKLEETFEQMRLNEHQEKDDEDNDSSSLEQNNEIIEESQMEPQPQEDDMLDDETIVEDEAPVEENSSSVENSHEAPIEDSHETPVEKSIDTPVEGSNENTVEDNKQPVMDDVTEYDSESLPKTEN